MPRLSRISTSALLAALAVSLGACGAEDPSAPDGPDGGPVAEVTCTDLGLASSSGVPLERIPIGALPASFDAPFAAELSTGGGTPLGLAYVREDETGDLYLAVPVHPTEPITGGAVQLTFTDGSEACASVPFTILPLPAASGELAAVVELLQAELAAAAQRLETTPEELRAAAIEDMSPSLWPLAFAQTLIDDPANDEALSDVVDGALGADVLALADRLLAQTGLREALESSALPNAQQTTSADPSAGLATDVGSAPERSVAGLLCTPDFVTTGEQLDFCMETAAEMAASATGLSREVSEDIQQVFADLESNQLPLAGEVKAVFGAMFWVIYTQREQAASLLPSRLTAIDVMGDPVALEEDDERPATITANVYATSLGYNLQGQIIDGLNEAAGLVQTTGKFDFSTGTPLDDVAAKIAPKFESRLRDLQIDELDIPSELFGPVLLTEATWFTARLVEGEAVEVVGDVQFEGRRAGPAKLSVRTADGEFGGSQIAGQLDVEVKTLQVTISPTEASVAPGDPKSFDVTVARSYHPESVAVVNPGSLQGSAELTIGEGGAHYVTYVAPENPDFGRVDLLTVEHTATTGARAGQDPPRRAVATIRFGSITIDPRSACVDLSGTRQFSAPIEGPTDTTVVWDADHGWFTDDGEYTAPSARPDDGVDMIYAHSAAFPALRDSVTIDIGCTCSSTLTLGGVPIVAEAGDEVYFTDWGGPTDEYGNNHEFFGITFRRADGSSTYTLPLEDDPATWPTQGPNPVRVQGNVGLSDGEIIYSSDDEFPAILTLEEYIPETKAVGTVTAEVTIASTQPPYSEPSTLRWSFAVTVPPGFTRSSFPSSRGWRYNCSVGGS
jgi:hypothetical protein